ncbi:MAG: lipid-A-disaccharide synthase [Pseudomonadota bacterium]|nr:lipid-A-disaccharide synthase [Pseudomonadota bacterium]
MTFPHIYLIAGEPSGDRLGALLIQALRRKTRLECKISGIGGMEMQKMGLHSHFPMSELTVMGLAEILPRLPNLYKRIRETVRHILDSKPDVVVTIDAPDFTFRVIQQIRGENIPIVHYVAPSVWAWKPWRAKKLAGLVDHLLTLLPFEPPYFEREGLKTTFVGHPVIESGADKGKGNDFRQHYGISPEEKILCLLPGSRPSEVSRIMPILKEIVLRLDNLNLNLFIPTLDTVGVLIGKEIKSWKNTPIIINNDEEKYSAFAASDAAIAVSGTVALELAIAKVPYLTIYKFNPITALIGRAMIKTPFVNIVNILLGCEVVPELIQKNCKSDIIIPYLLDFFDNPNSANAQVVRFNEAINQLRTGNQNPSDRAAKVVLDLIQ